MWPRNEILLKSDMEQFRTKGNRSVVVLPPTAACPSCLTHLSVKVKLLPIIPHHRSTGAKNVGSPEREELSVTYFYQGQQTPGSLATR